MSPCVVEFVLSDSVGPSFERDDLLLGERAVVIVVCRRLALVMVALSEWPMSSCWVTQWNTFVVHRLLPIIQAFQLKKQRRLHALLKVGAFGL